MADIKEIFGQAFDSQSVEPHEARGGVMPAGTYSLEVVDAEVKPTKKGDGTLLAISFAVIDPEQFAKRRVFENLCIQHPNPQTEQIAQGKLSALCRAVGIVQLDDTDQLLGRVVRARVKIRPAQGQYEEQNEIAAYETAAVPPPATPPVRTPPAQVNAKVAPPWQKRV